MADLIAELEGVVRRIESVRDIKGGELKKFAVLAECYAYLDTHHAEIAAAVRDAARLDWLETMANKPGGLLLHDGSESGRCGLGLRPGAVNRTLREACDTAMRAGEGEG